MELVALVFSRTSPAVSDSRVREAFSLAIDRSAISNILLQRAGEPASGLLPAWISGYAAAFLLPYDSATARQLRMESRSQAAIKLAYPATDALLRVIAERIALNVRDIGSNVQLAPDAGSADVRLSAAEIVSTDPLASLIGVADELGVTEPALDAYSAESAYRAERAMEGDHWIVPIVFTERSFAVSPRVRNWSLQRNGRWRADEVWVSQEMR
jgi:hypothetical protein